jgi:uncharacterized protein YndB with AHSA1/START domain
MNAQPFVIERTYNASADAVWKAITDKQQMKEWYFDLEEFKAEKGFEFSFWGEDGDKKFLHLCRVTEVIPGKKLSYTWKYKDYPGESVVSFELIPEGDKTRLVLTHAGLETFPSEHSSFRRESFEKGWTEIIGTSLKKFLEK